jgi:hypothetical protein
MSRIEDDEIPSTTGDDEAKLKEYAAIHLEGTGFPWQEEANVYIAGHRLGFPNTESWLTFWDMNKVSVGDEVYVTDADGTRYTYKVFKELHRRPLRHLRHGHRAGQEHPYPPDLHPAGLLSATDRPGRAHGHLREGGVEPRRCGRGAPRRPARLLQGARR